MSSKKKIKWQEDNQLELEQEYDLFIETSTNPASELGWADWVNVKYKEFKSSPPCV